MSLSWTTHAKDNVFWIFTITGMVLLLWKLKRETGGDEPPGAR